MENFITPQQAPKESTFKKVLPYILIVIILLLAGGLYLQFTKKNPVEIKNQLTTVVKKMENEKGVDFNNYGQAPDFSGISNWLNSSPLSISDLKGKVVLVDFWTYSCINCIRTLPYVTKLYDTYKDQGLVVIGVHTPEFAFEKDTANVQDAIKRFKINYPVAQDNNYRTWDAYKNQYWPAEYLINQDGEIVYMHFGEGNYDITEKAVQQLLHLDSSTQVNNTSPEFMRIKSPEMYFGTDRLENLTPSQTPSLSPTNYSLPKNLALNNFALEGNWKFDGEKASLVSGKGKIALRFSSGKIHFVAKSSKPQEIQIMVDGKQQKSIVVNESMLYTLFDSENYSEHTIEIIIPEAGLEAFTFTFG